MKGRLQVHYTCNIVGKSEEDLRYAKERISKKSTHSTPRSEVRGMPLDKLRPRA
jgi:hypothetical protein